MKKPYLTHREAARLADVANFGVRNCNYETDERLIAMGLLDIQTADRDRQEGDLTMKLIVAPSDYLRSLLTSDCQLNEDRVVIRDEADVIDVRIFPDQREALATIIERHLVGQRERRWNILAKYVDGGDPNDALVVAVDIEDIAPQDLSLIRDIEASIDYTLDILAAIAPDWSFCQVMQQLRDRGEF